MKLEINLADREEIAAAVPLLQLLLDGTGAKTCSGQCSHTMTHAVGEVGITNTVTCNAKDIEGFVTRTQVPEGEEFHTISDPAAVFGDMPSAPLAPSIPPAPVPATSVPPAPGNTAPIMPTFGGASSGAVASSVDLDNRGLPWDSRIHSSSKAKLANGNWKNARGKAPEYVAQIEAELQGHAGAAVPVAPILPSIPAVPASASADPTTFEQLMTRITAAVTAGVMPPTAVGAACAAHGLTSVVALQQSPQFVPLVWATLKQQYPALV